MAGVYFNLVKNLKFKITTQVAIFKRQVFKLG